MKYKPTEQDIKKAKAKVKRLVDAFKRDTQLKMFIKDDSVRAAHPQEFKMLKTQLSPEDYAKHRDAVREKFKMQHKSKTSMKKLTRLLFRKLIWLSLRDQRAFIEKLIELRWFIDFSKYPCKCGGNRKLEFYQKL
jgi:hypothetical protein